MIEYLEEGRRFRLGCGCAFDVLGPSPCPNDPLPLFKLDVENPPSCPLTWEMLARGLTTGVFQLGSGLGRSYSRKMKPKTLEHMNALTALLRPGCLDVELDDGRSMTQVYVDRVNGEAVPKIHPVIDEVLNRSYNVMTFQEQAMRLSEVVAGFDKLKQDKLRKSIGKKLQAEIAAVGREFLEGVKTAGVIPYDLGVWLWDIIKKSGRYLFNLAHSAVYGCLSYSTAYVKSHFPVLFFTAAVAWAKEKGAKAEEELRLLVGEAKEFGVPVLVPSFGSLEPDTWTDGTRVVMGLTEVKGMGYRTAESLTEAVRKLEPTLGPVSTWAWNKTVVHLDLLVPSNVAKALVCVGAMHTPVGATDPPGPTRQRQLAEVDAWLSLNDAERAFGRAWAGENGYPPLTAVLRAAGRLKATKARPEGGGCSTPRRAEYVRGRADALDKPAAGEVDSPRWLVQVEEDLLGVALSAARVEEYDSPSATHVLADIPGLTPNTTVAVAAQVVRVREHTTAKGDTMAFVTLADRSLTFDGVVLWAAEYAKFKAVLSEGACVLVRGKVRSRGGSKSLAVDTARELN